jgi:hypothetical protein
MAHAHKPDFVFRRNGRVHLNRQGRQFSRLPAAEGRTSAVVMLDTPCSEVLWRVLVTHSIHQFPLHFPSRASPCAITFQLDSTSLFDSMEQGPSSEPNGFSATQFPTFYGWPRHMTLLIRSRYVSLFWARLIHCMPFCFFQFYFNVTLPSIFRCSKMSSFLSFATKAYLLSYACAPNPTQFILLHWSPK